MTGRGLLRRCMRAGGRAELERRLRRWRSEIDSRNEAVETLNEAGFTRTADARYRALLLSMLLVIGFAAALVLGAPDAVVGGGVALGAVLLGAQQFAASRNEVSLEKFYDRLQVTNDKLEEYPATREFIGLPAGNDESAGQVDDDEFFRRMYVFRELDNLEYSIAKYRIGFMSPENAQRSLRTFRSRCVSSERFRAYAHDQVHMRDDRDPGYDEETRLVVCRIVQELGDPVCEHSTRESLQSARPGRAGEDAAEPRESWKQGVPTPSTPQALRSSPKCSGRSPQSRFAVEASSGLRQAPE